jgi:hypothetical protein
MTRGLPVHELERLAEVQRGVLEGRVVELRRTVQRRLDVKENIRDHVGLAVAAMGLLGAVLGYAVAGVFTKR